MMSNDRSTTDNVRDPLDFEGGMGKRPEQPKQPDYVGAAKTQAMGSIGANLANNLMSHPNVNSPLGQQTWKQIGSTKLNIPGIGEVDIPQYEQNMTLSPEQQKLYEGTTSAQGSALDQVRSNLSTPFSMQSANDVADKAYGAITSRLDPQWDRREDMQRNRLSNEGHFAGSEAHKNAMMDFDFGRNDAYQQANLAAIQTMPQTFDLEQKLRDLPINELNALKSGSPVNMPQFQASQFAQGAQAPNLTGAVGQQSAWEQAMYNAQVGTANANKQGAAALGGTALMAFSDRRLKSNIVKVGEHEKGFGIYEYDIFDRRERGVMADEVEKVMPEAVGEIDGFKTVNYGML